MPEKTELILESSSSDIFMKSISTRLMVNENEFYNLRNDWNLLHGKIKGTVFQSFDWNARWWQLYKEGINMRTLTFWSRNQLVGVVPLFSEVRNLLLLKITRLRLFGAYEIYGEYTPLIHPDLQSELIAALANFCFKEISEGRIDIVELYRFPHDSKIMEKFIERIERLPLHVRFNPKRTERILMTLPATYEKYLETLSVTEQKMLIRRQKSLDKQGVILEIIQSIDQFENDFSDLGQLHSLSWKKKRSRGYFLMYKHFHQFLYEAIAELIQKDNARLYFFKHEGKRIACVLAFFMNNICYFYLSGYDPYNSLARFSPGKVLLSQVIRDAIKKQCSVFDFHGGAEDYKFQLGGRLTWFGKIVIYNKGFHALNVVPIFWLQAVHQMIKENFIDQSILNVLRKRLRRKHNNLRKMEN